MTDQDRISQIEQSLSGLEKQIRDLKLELNELKNSKPSASADARQTATAVVVTEPLPAPAVTTAPSSAPAAASAVMHSDTKTTSSPTAKPSAASRTVAASPAKGKSASRFEDNLGGKVMGIIAAVLVFVGLFLFGSILYERLGDTARVTILFILSFLILGAGLFLERRHPSRFTTSLIGCGFGTVYISLFVAALYYEMFRVEVLYLLLLFWLIGVGLYVFHRQSFTVAFLGQVGIAFSVIFGCLGIESKAQFTFLCIYFTLLSLLYLWIVLWRFLPRTKDKPYSWIHLTAVGLNLIQLLALSACYESTFGDYGSIGGKNTTAGILLCIYCLILPLFFLLRQRLLAGLVLFPQLSPAHSINDKTFPVYKTGFASVWVFTVYQIIVWITFAIVSGNLFEAEVPRGMLLLSGLLLSYVLIEVFGATGIEGRGASIITAVAVPVILLQFDFPDVLLTVIPMVFGAVTVLFGMFGNECPVHSVFQPLTGRWEYVCQEEQGRCIEKFTSFAYLLPFFSYFFFNTSKDDYGILLLNTIYGVLFFAGTFIFLYNCGRKHRYANAWKIVLYLFAMGYLFYISAYFVSNTSLDEIVQMAIVLTLLVLCNCVAYYSGFRRKIAAQSVNDLGATIAVRLVHTALWIWGIALLHSGAIEDYPFLCIWLILLTLYLCGNGLYEQYKTYHGKPGLGIYFGLRITLYVLAVLTAFDGIEGYAVSCVLLILAILAVLAGFPLRLAALRIYGLCLAMLAVVKLLMIDVEHDNSMETVLCFLGAGALCFAINFIYNHVKKRFANSDAG